MFTIKCFAAPIKQSLQKIATLQSTIFAQYLLDDQSHSVTDAWFIRTDTTMELTRRAESCTDTVHACKPYHIHTFAFYNFLGSIWALAKC